MKKIIFNSVQVFLVRGLGSIAGFAMTLVVTNVASVHDAGLFMLVLAVIQLAGGLTTLGAESNLLKVIAANCDRDWRAINNVVSIVLMMIGTIGTVLFILAWVFDQSIGEWVGQAEFSQYSPHIVVSIVLFAATMLISAMLQGKQLVVRASLVQNAIAPLGFISAIAVVMLLNIRLDWIVLSNLFAASLLLATLIGLYTWFSDNRANFDFSSRLTPELKSSMSALFIAMLMQQLVQWSGQFATAKYLSTTDIAYFSTAQRTAFLASFVLIAVNLVVAPQFAAAFSKGERSKVNGLSRFSSRLMMLMATPVLLLMVAFPEFLMGFFGEEYKAAAPLLQIMAVGQFINVVTGSVGYLLNMTGHEKDMRNVVLICGPIAIILAFGLTSQFGLMGAAYATAISVATQNLLAVSMVKKRLGFNTLNIFRRID